MSNRIGIEQQLVGVETVPGFRLIGPVHPIAVDRARTHIGEIAMPDLIGVLRQFDPFELLLAFVVEEADLYLGCVGGEDSEVRALSIPRGASWVGKAFSDRRCAPCGHDDVSSCTSLLWPWPARDACVSWTAVGLVQRRPTDGFCSVSLF